RVGQGSLDTRTANCIGHMSNIALSAMKFNFRMECEERKAARADSPRDSSSKKPPHEPLRLEITTYGSNKKLVFPDPTGESAKAFFSEDEKAERPQNSVSRESVESKKLEPVEAAKPASVEPAKPQPLLENNPKVNGPSVELASPAPPPVSSAAKQTEVRNEVKDGGVIVKNEMEDGVKIKNEIKNKVRIEARNESKNEVRQEHPLSGVPGLSPHHLNYLNYPELCGVPLQKRQRLPHCYVTSMSPRKVELMMQEARNRRRR
ncbi:MAG TPA: hypothetical protein VFA71_06520, partial [Terriglobales bacterium]|nr:hypothetical protein [Terriglobales bacterium]